MKYKLPFSYKTIAKFILLGGSFYGNILMYSVGITFHNGDLIAHATLMTGFITSFFLWFVMTKDEKNMRFYERVILRIMYVIFAGMAVYVTLATACWVVGLPVSIGTVKHGLMTKYYWYGPSLLAYSAILYYLYERARRKIKNNLR